MLPVIRAMGCYYVQSVLHKRYETGAWNTHCWPTSRTPMPWQRDFNCCSVVLAARFSIDIVLVLGTAGCWADTSGCCGGIAFVATTDRPPPPYMFTTVLTIVISNKFSSTESERVLELMGWQQEPNCTRVTAAANWACCRCSSEFVNQVTTKVTIVVLSWRSWIRSEKDLIH
jgi:hypothetical protein